MKEISLTRGYIALVDDEDYSRLSIFKWQVIAGAKTFYAIRSTKYLKTEKRRTIRMHREILGLYEHDGFEIDHINRNGLDNRKSNLRLCSRSQNQSNRSLLNNNTSGFKGVNFHRGIVRHFTKDRWDARIMYEGKSIYLGSYPDPHKAALAYDKAALKYFGGYAFLNFAESSNHG